MRFHKLLFLSALSAMLAAVLGCSRSESRTFDVSIRTEPSVVYAAVEGIDRDPASPARVVNSDPYKLTWLFHLVIESQESEALAIEEVEAVFRRGEETVWREVYPRGYLERMEWIQGAYEMTKEYYLTKVYGKPEGEKPAGPDLPPGENVSWVRIPFSRPVFANADSIELVFRMSDAKGKPGVVTFTIPVVYYQQKVTLRLPFEGTWAVYAGNDLSTGHRRTGLNGLTTYGWDFVKVGENGLLYRTDGKEPEDYYGHGEPVHAAGDGVVVDVRNDIPDYPIGETAARELLEEDGDVFAGNFVSLDHGDGEYSLTCHLLAGSIPVKVGDPVKAGQFIGRVGNSNALVPHVHFNLMTGPEWLEAKGLPALFSNFERTVAGFNDAARPGVSVIERGNPLQSWLVRPASE